MTGPVVSMESLLIAQAALMDAVNATRRTLASPVINGGRAYWERHLVEQIDAMNEIAAALRAAGQ